MTVRKFADDENAGSFGRIVSDQIIYFFWLDPKETKIQGLKSFAASSFQKHTTAGRSPAELPGLRSVFDAASMQNFFRPDLASNRGFGVIEIELYRGLEEGDAIAHQRGGFW